eukprot:6205405-Pleurochrysis_carterae.AAC.1
MRDRTRLSAWRHTLVAEKEQRVWDRSWNNAEDAEQKSKVWARRSRLRAAARITLRTVNATYDTYTNCNSQGYEENMDVYSAAMSKLSFGNNASQIHIWRELTNEERYSSPTSCVT